MRPERARHQAGEIVPGQQPVDDGDAEPLLYEGERDDRDVDLHLRAERQPLAGQRVTQQLSWQRFGAVGDQRLAVEILGADGLAPGQRMPAR